MPPQGSGLGSLLSALRSHRLPPGPGHVGPFAHPLITWQLTSSKLARGGVEGPAVGSPRGGNPYTGLTACHLCHPLLGRSRWWSHSGSGRGDYAGQGAEGQVGISIQSQHMPETTFPGPRAENRHGEGSQFSRQLNWDSEGRNPKWGGASSSGSAITCIVDTYNVYVTHIYIYTCTYTPCI